MRKGKIHIGTSGWSYNDWKGVYYPEGMKSTDWLTYYAQDFDIVEINASFYRLPKEETVIKWAEKVPARFKFCPKMSRYLTHIKRLKEPEEPLQRFFSVFDPIQKRIGPILIQLPPRLKFEREKTEHLFKLLRQQYRGYNFVLEVRDETWLEEESVDLMKQYKVGFVISQSGVGFPYAELITSKHVYIRFHGPGKLYASKYTNKMMAEYAEKIRTWSEAGHTIWVFFNNDWFTYAIQDARTLMEMLGMELKRQNVIKA